MLSFQNQQKYPRPNKYPLVIILRNQKYQSIDTLLESNANNLSFAYEIVNYVNEEDIIVKKSKSVKNLQEEINKRKDSRIKFLKKNINKLYSEEYNVLLTIGDSWLEYRDITPFLIPKINHKWVHLTLEQASINELNNRILNCFIHYIPQRSLYRPKISCFTTSFKSFQKILRPFNSLQKQTFQDWEWVIIDDSDDDEHFQFMKENISSQDHRIRYFRKDYNNGNIGNVKNEAVSLCRGDYVLELDHDDEILPDCLEEIVSAFNKYPDVGFVYMNFTECYEDYKPFTYGPSWGMGYGGYYSQEYDGHRFEVATSVDINDVTMSNIVGVPNHPRAWRKSTLLEIGNYSECLPIADDYELLVLTCLKTKMLKINKLGYIQYKNSGNNNFSLIRNREITKLQNAISRNYYQKFNVPEFFRNQGVEESKKRENKCINITIDSAIHSNPSTTSTETTQNN